MIVCVNCKKEMTCTKTGRPLVWQNSHVYSGDEFTCADCNNIVISVSSTPYNVLDAMNKLEKSKPINMTPSF